MRVRRRGKTRVEPLPPMVRRYFETGDYTGITGEGWFHAYQIASQLMGAASHGGVCAAWTEHGSEITAEWASRYPATRPFAWWALDAPAPRLLVSGQEGLRPVAPCIWRLQVGIPVSAHDIHTGDPALCVESQARYLMRHDLLTEPERRALTDEDFKPERLVSDEDDSREGGEAVKDLTPGSIAAPPAPATAKPARSMSSNGR